jgi:DNA topoisomerase-1
MPKRLVIVESPAKARTISRFLGKDFVVDSSIGHIRDLPSSAAQIPAAVKKEKWARLGVNVDKDFEPLYVVPAEKKKKVAELKEHLKGADELLLATDEDREGEAISWHLLELLKPKVPFSRLVFHEITREAIHEALTNTRPLDERLVSAQETRRILDRLYGYEVSPLLWKKIAPKLSAGRVQSVAIRLVVERERARIRFREAAYWDVEGLFATAKHEEFPATLVTLGGKRVALGKDFDPETGTLTNKDVVLVDGARAQSLAKDLCRQPWKVLETETKPFVQNPPAPFTTSTLQQEGARKLRLSARRTMQIAQRLYENGYITYMRTDSTTLSDQALAAARQAVLSLYGDRFLSDQPRQFKTKVRNAQEAHEAIRPAGDHFRTPADLGHELHGEDFRLYELIWMRTMASQMAEARGRRMTVRLGAADAVFQASGKVIDFPGFLRVYVEGSDDPEADLAEQETLLPAMEKGDPLTCRNLEAKEHRTQPPARFTEASLVKELEANGIGRPSTYASIIDTIERREYTFKRGTALVPTYLAFAVVNLMEKHFTELVDPGFTARMEDDLDAISRGEAQALPYLKAFYFGNGHKGLRAQLDEKAEHIDPREVCTLPLGKTAEGADVAVRVGRYGPYLQSGDSTAPIPDGTAPDEITLARAIEILSTAQQGPRVLGQDAETGAAVTVRDGRFGPYVQLGEAEGKQKPKTASLLRGMTPDSVDLPTALKLLSLPRTVGQDELGVDIMVANGRFGPFLKRGTDTRSLAGEEQIFTLTRDEALALLAQPKQGRRGGAPQALRSLGPAEALGGVEVKLMDGRYGPYVTDGTHNASLPRGADPAALTIEAAVELIEARKARGPAPKRGGRRMTARAAAKPKPAAKPSAAAKPKEPAKAKVTKKKAVTKKKTAKKKSTKNAAGSAST